MNKNIGILLLVFVLLMVGCYEEDKGSRNQRDDEENESLFHRNDEENLSNSQNDKEDGVLTSAYNQAYIENYETDTLEEILENASHSYVLLDPSEEDIVDYIEEIQANDNEVAAYISIGTGEAWRDDFEELEPFLVEKQWGEWDGEYFVNTTTTGIVEVMKKRINDIADMGFDWVEFDNMDWAFDDEMRDEYEFEVTVEESIEYYTTLCDYANEKGLKCMAKSLASDIEGFDGATFESYSDELNWWEEDELIEFIETGDKVVLIIHYDEKDSDEAYAYYTDIYGESILFLCEERRTEKYKHYYSSHM